MNHADIQAKVKLVTDIANKLRGPYTPEKYGNVIIPMAILRRFDCVLAEKNEKIKPVLAKMERLKTDEASREQAVKKACGVAFYKRQMRDFRGSGGRQRQLGANFLEFIGAYSKSIAEIVKGLKFRDEVEFMIKKGLLFEVVKAFAAVDFHPATTDEFSMGYVFEEIIRTYKANAEAGDHYTPREVIELCVDLMMAEGAEELKKPGKLIRIYDGCCGTGGMLTVAKRKLKETLGTDENVRLFGQDSNPESHAICRAEMLMLGDDPRNVHEGNTLTEDKLKGEKFDLTLTNPPFGVEWKTEKALVEKEFNDKYGSRFMAGLPRISDGQLLFLQNLIAKTEPDGRIAIILNGSPLFSGDAGSGESEVRRYVLENDLVEAIIALPEKMFYNTGIFTYVWILSKNKAKKRRKKVQLIDATGMWDEQKPKSLGNKRKEITAPHRKEIARLYRAFKDAETVKILAPEDFGYQKVTVERPLRDEKGQIVLKKGKKQADPALRDTENVPLKEKIDEYIAREVLPYAPDAWVDDSKTKIGYEIPFTRYFYRYVPPKPSRDILKEVVGIEEGIRDTLASLLGRNGTP
jgi:type I restriction enzyme M protein